MHGPGGSRRAQASAERGSLLGRHPTSPHLAHHPAAPAVPRSDLEARRGRRRRAPRASGALRLAALALLLLSTAPAARASEWTRTDTALELGLLGLSLTDYSQTCWFLSNRPRAYETNPILGRHPSRGKIVTFGAVTLTAHVIVARALPQPYRRLWQAVGIAVELDAVTSNARTFGFHLAF